MEWFGGVSQVCSMASHQSDAGGPCPRAALAGFAQLFIHRQPQGCYLTESMRGTVCLLVASCSPPLSRRLLKFGVRWPASPLCNHHAIKEFFLEICVPMGSN